MTSQDFQKRLDLTGLTTFTASDISQTVETAYPASDKGLTIVTTDTAVGVPDVPDPSDTIEGVTVTHWQNYIWIRRPHASDTTGVVIAYLWNPVATSHATYLKWEADRTDISELLDNVEELQIDVAALETSVATANTNATNAVNTANTATTTVASYQTNIDTLTGQINALTTSLDAAEDDIETLEAAILEPIYGVGGLYESLKVYNNVANPTTQIDVVASYLSVRDTRSQLKVLQTVAVTANISAAIGANGPDATVLSGRWYYIYVIYNATTMTTAALLSESATAPSMPSGYTYRARVGVVHYLSPNLHQFYQIDNQVWYETIVNIFDAKASGAATGTFVTLAGADLVAFELYIPPLAKTARGNIGMIDDGTAANMDMGIAATAAGLGLQTFNGQPGSQLNNFACSAPFSIPMKTRNLWWNTFHGAAVAKHRLEITGFSI